MEDRSCQKDSSSLPVNGDVLLIRLQGMFYNSYEDSAKVLSVLTGYKIKQVSAKSKLKCGFPSNALDKNIALFNASHISFCIMNKDKVVAEHYTLFNMYKDYLHAFDDKKVIRNWEDEPSRPGKVSLDSNLDKKKTSSEKDVRESFFRRLKNKVGKFL